MLVDNMLFVAKAVSSEIVRTMMNSQGLEIPNVRRLLQAEVVSITMTIRSPEWMFILAWTFRYLLEEKEDLSKVAVFCDLLEPLDILKAFPFKEMSLCCSHNDREGMSEILTHYIDSD